MDITKEVKNDLIILIRENLNPWKSWIEPQTDDDDETPYTELTIGLNPDGSEWSYQTGDNSFTGGAYFFPHWAVMYICADTEMEDLLSDIFTEIDSIEIA